MYQRVVSLPAGRDIHYFIPPPSARSGLEFEDFIFRQVSIGGASTGEDLKFQRSPRSGDDGKDIIIEGKLRSLFGQHFPLNARKTICEVKYSSGGLLKLSRFADTLLRVDEDVTDVVIISNNTPSPRTVYYAQKQIEVLEKRLHFVSGTDLNRWSPVEQDGIEDHLICVQLDERTYPNKIHFFIKNLSSTETRDFAITSRRDEVTRTNEQLEYLLGPGEFRAGEAELLDVGEIVDSDQINFDVSINDKRFDVRLNRHLDTKSISLPFWGSANLESLTSCKVALTDYPAPVILAEGAAGVGKSRFAEELTRSVRTLGRPVLTLNRDALSSLTELTKLVKRESEHLHALLEGCDDIVPIDRLFSALRKDELNATVVIFEDAHSFSQSQLEHLRTTIKGLDDKHRPAILVTGRNDNTFFNPAYFLFVEFVRSEVFGARSVFLRPLPRNEERGLIQHVISHVPEALVDRVQFLSNGNPFHLILTLEWLVENDLFQIVNNQRVAVVDGKKFADEQSLPTEIQDMFQQSLSALNEYLPVSVLAGFGLLALHSEFGFDQRSEPLDVAFQNNAFFDSFACANSSWRHDLAKTAFLEIVLTDGEFIETRRFMLEVAKKHPNAIPSEKLALLAFRCNDFELAWSAWGELKRKVDEVQNITSINFDAKFFESFYLFAKLCFMKEEPSLASQALVVWSYLGCHYANLAIGQSACERALNLIATSAPGQFSTQTNAIKALELRSLIDSGLVNIARKKALECEMGLALGSGKQEPAHLFDYQLNRSDLQRLLNDRTGALYFLDQACQSAGSDLGPLEFVNTSHRAALEIEPAERIRLLALLTSDEGPPGTERHVLLAECMLSRVQMLSHSSGGIRASDEVASCLFRAKKMVERQFISALPIAYRAAGLASFCAFLVDDFDPLAMRDVYRLAENSCILKGEAESLPLVLNDLAVVEYQISGRLQDAMMFLASAVDILNLQGRLDLGNADLTSANQVIVSNFIQMIAKTNYAGAVDFALERLQWADKAAVASRGWMTKEIDRMHDTGIPFLSKTSGMYLLRCEASGLHLVG